MDFNNSFLADAINALANLGKKAAEPKQLTVNGHSFLLAGESLEEIEPIETPKPEKATTRSLNALVALVKTEVAALYKDPLYVPAGS